jgi:carboxypeptidase C (cathepsin A)
VTRLPLAVVAAFCVLWSAQARPQDARPDSGGAEAKNQREGAPRPERSVTQGSVVIGGKTIHYTATAGTLIVRNDKDAPWASIGYVAYTENGASDPGRRPLTFAYNGGPGSSSLWLHMGALGPRRIVVADPDATPPPPYRVVDNAYSLLDRTDLVMIDPVGTGVSKAVGNAKDKDFWGVDRDVESLSRFIAQYVTDNGRWNSPKYLLGESYGTTRSAAIADFLQTKSGMAFNGVILVSFALNLGAIFDEIPGNQQPYPLFLPTYAAVAWYHRALPQRPPELLPFLDEVRTYALGEYAHALMLGNGLTASERAAVIAKLHGYTGLSADYLDKADLRVQESQFTEELLREKRETVGRLDARFLGYTFDPLGEHAPYDPQEAAIAPAFTAAFLDYYRRELKFGEGKTYVVEAPVWKEWDYSHKVAGSEFPQPMVDTGVDLAHALGYNPNLRVLVLQGYFDLATPFLATEYVLSHLPLSHELRSHIEIKYYEAGHMMYVHEPSLEKFKADVGKFIDETDRL